MPEWMELKCIPATVLLLFVELYISSERCRFICQVEGEGYKASEERIPLSSRDNAMEKDINDAFDDILLCEERITQEAYEEGVQQGKIEGNPEGYHLGYHRGAEIGAELGYYLGVVKIYLTKEENKNKKVISQLEKLKSLIESFPETNDENFDIIGKIDDIRANYKKVCSLLKIDGKFPEADKLNF